MESCDLIVSILQYFMPILEPMMGESSEEWLTAILAAAGCDGKTEVPQADADDVPWMKDSFWKGKKLEDDDRANKKEGYYPKNCQFWNVKENNKNIYGIEVDPYYVDECSKMLNAGTNVSYKVFNRMHYYDPDTTLTIGFQHLAVSNVTDFFSKMKEEKTKKKKTYFSQTFDEMCEYITYRLLRNDPKDKYILSYRLQVANEDKIKEKLFPGEEDKINPERLESIDPNKLLETIRLFFTEVLLDKTKYVSLVTNTEIYGIQHWVEEKMQEYSTKDMGLKPDLKTMTLKNNTIMKMLFQGGDDNPDEFESGFWFHDIVKDALLLKDVAMFQIKFWEDKFYVPAVEKLKVYLDADKNSLGKYGLNSQKFEALKDSHSLDVVTGILSFVSYQNSATGFGIRRVDVEEEDDVTDPEAIKVNSTVKDSKKIDFNDSVIMLSEKYKLDTKKPATSDDEIKTLILLSGVLYEEYQRQILKKTSNRGKTKHILKYFWSKVWETTSNTDLHKLRFLKENVDQVKRKEQK